MTYAEALRSFAPRHEAVLMLSHVTGQDATELAVNPSSPLTEKQEAAFMALVEKRRKHVPLQYLLGRWPFMGLDFVVNPSVLIPRQDTETLAEACVKAKPRNVLDLCTGSGCVAVSVAKFTNARVIATDISLDAIFTAQKNARINDVDGKICFVKSDLFSAVRGKFDMIVSNPPYIPSGQIQNLQEEVRDYEPRLALDGGADGLDFYRKIIAQAGRFLTEGGALYLEAGDAEGISHLFATHGYKDITTLKDLAGLERVVYATHGGNEQNKEIRHV